MLERRFRQEWRQRHFRGRRSREIGGRGRVRRPHNENHFGKVVLDGQLAMSERSFSLWPIRSSPNPETRIWERRTSTLQVASVGVDDLRVVQRSCINFRPLRGCTGLSGWTASGLLSSTRSRSPTTSSHTPATGRIQCLPVSFRMAMRAGTLVRLIAMGLRCRSAQTLQFSRSSRSS